MRMNPETLESNLYHTPVLCGAVVEGLKVHPQSTYLDVTVGGGGHSTALLSAGAARIVALDQDQQALTAAQLRLADWSDQVTFRQLNFANFDLQHDGLRNADGNPVLFDGILADLGVSSAQLDRPERGFSFRSEGPLDMRMDPSGSGKTAADWVNHSDAVQLVEIFSRFGEEHYAKRIARQIVERRPFSTTTQLAAAISAAVPPAARHGRIHPATRVFQALRIAVNQELQVLETFLDRSPDWLRPGGRIAVISFHSLEDRLVKWAWRGDPRLRVITPRPLQADPEEAKANPRSRSAKLRIAERQETNSLSQDE